MGVNPLRGVGPSKRPLLESDIKRAQENTRSASEAARFLHVDYKTYKKYAKMYGLFEQHKNPTGKGIARVKKRGKFGLDDILSGKHPTYDKTRLKERIIRAGYLAEECALCGYNKKRELDGRCPLILHCVDGNEHNLKLDNLQLRCYNCFAGWETFITIDGIKSFEETVGTTQIVLTYDGKWRESRIEEFGIQPLQEVTFKPSTERNGRSKTHIRHKIICTPDHRWLTINRGEVTDLREGDIVPFTKHKIESFNLEAWIRGFGFGDGTIGSKNRAQIRLCGDKDLKWIERFEAYGNCSISFSPSYQGDALIMFRKGYMTDWKMLPVDKDINYLASWLDGYIAADGCVSKNGGIELSSQNADAITFVKKIAPLVGYIVTGQHTSTVMETNLGRRKHHLQKIILQKHGVFKVMEIKPLDNVVERVYCAVEPETHTFTLANGILTGNCSYLTTGRVSAKHIMNPGVYDQDLLDTGITMDEIERIQNEMMRE